VAAAPPSRRTKSCAVSFSWELAHATQQMRTGTGESFDAVSVQWVRFSAKLKSLKERLLEAGWLTSKQIAAQLGVSLTTVGGLRSDGRLKGRICSDKGEWVYFTRRAHRLRRRVVAAMTG
jgi:hypothetical protein